MRSHDLNRLLDEPDPGGGASLLKIHILGKYRMPLFEGKLCSARDLAETVAVVGTLILALTYRLCPHSSHGSRSIWRPRSPAKSQRLVRIRAHAKSGAAERVNRSAPFPPHFLRVAASSNPSFQRTALRLPLNSNVGRQQMNNHIPHHYSFRHVTN